jgi:ASCH domain
MRVISLWQPWAELIRRGLKQFETRSWPCETLGQVVIQAAKKKFRPGAASGGWGAQAHGSAVAESGVCGWAAAAEAVLRGGSPDIWK